VSKLSDVKLLPVIDYRFNATFYPDSVESKEQLPLEQLQQVVAYSDFTSTIYDTPIPTEVIRKEPLYTVPSEISFTKAFLDWQILRKGAQRKDIRVRLGQFERTLLFQWRINLPFNFDFLDPDFWIKNQILIPTYYVDSKTGKRMCFIFDNMVLIDCNVTISTDQVNTISCTLFGFNPQVTFKSLGLNDNYDFDSWINDIVEIHTSPDDIGLVSQHNVFSMSISQRSSVNFVTYKNETPTKDIWYIYIPKPNGSFQRVNGYINLSSYVTDFDAYQWVLVQSQPHYSTTIELFDENYKFTRINVSKIRVDVKRRPEKTNEQKKLLLGTIELYVTDFDIQELRITASGYGRIIR